MGSWKDRGYRIMGRGWYVMGYAILALCAFLGAISVPLYGWPGLLWVVFYGAGAGFTVQALREEGWWV